MKVTYDLKIFLKYTLLNVLSMIGLSCYILADTFFISRGLGADGLTALNLAIPVYSFISGAGLMLGVGGATRYGIFRAQGRKKEGNIVFMNVVYGALAVSALFVVLGMGFSGSIAGLMGADVRVFEMTRIYLQVILLFSPAFIMNNIVNCFVRNDGDPRLSMLAMLMGSLSNIVMDYIFIFPMGLGMLGAVLATGFAPMIGLLILSAHFIKKRNGFSFHKEKVNAGVLCSAAALGVPSLVLEVSSGLVMILFNILILGISGNVGVAAYGVIANISLVVLSIYNGIAQGMQPVVSEAYGKGRKESVGNILGYGIITMILFSLLVYSGLYINADWIALAFNRDRDMVLHKIAVDGIKIYFAAIPFAGFNIILSSYFASVERAVPAQVISLLRGIVLIVPVGFAAAKMWGLTGVWVSFGITELITVMIGIIQLKKKGNER